uniref:TFIIE beta domain-containing protein n=1 Tax=Globodera pallida TaxID=36090 RepID=A0A183BQY0_GLOPA
MAKIVDYMKKRHLNQQPWALSLKEILEEMQVYDVNRKSMLWLQEALPRNPRLQAEADNAKFVYNPPFKVKNRATLLAILKKYHTDGKGGILLSDLSDCVPNAEAMAKALESQIIAIPTQINKRKDVVYFYNDPETDRPIDDDFVQLWRMAGVEHLDENKIEEYLQKHGLETARDLAPRKLAFSGPKRKQSKRAPQRLHNVHLEGVLVDYKTED